MRRVEELIPSKQMRAMDSELIDPVIEDPFELCMTLLLIIARLYYHL